MTEYFSPLRPRGPNGKPLWLGTNIVLPGLYVFPRLDGNIEVYLMRGDVGRWVIKCFEGGDFLAMMRSWKDDPEWTIENVFGEEPPKEIKAKVEPKPARVIISSPVDLTDLGF